MSTDAPAHLRRALRRSIVTVDSAWTDAGYRLPEHQGISLQLNTRFRRRLASADGSAVSIVLRGDASDWTPKLLREVLIHELAHLAVHAKHGGRARPHGLEWQRLMKLAGRPFTATFGRECVFGEKGLQEQTDSGMSAARTRNHKYEHRCPVCQMVRYAKRPVSQWRCRACTEIGLDGALAITRHT